MDGYNKIEWGFKFVIDKLKVNGNMKIFVNNVFKIVFSLWFGVMLIIMIVGIIVLIILVLIFIFKILGILFFLFFEFLGILEVDIVS